MARSVFLCSGLGSNFAKETKRKATWQTKEGN